MQASPPVQQPSPRMVLAVFTSGGLALVLASGLSVLAWTGGLLFTGLSTLIIELVTTAVCAVVTPVTAFIFRRKQRHFGWRTLLVQVSILACLAVGIMSWLDTRQHLQIFMDPSPVPSSVRVRHGHSVLFSSYVHFTGSPAAIASLIKSKGLVEVPAEAPNTSDAGGFSSRERTKDGWSWWQPTTMSNPKFFFRHHESKAVQGWGEGWWVSGATNEVYAFIGG